MASSSAEEDAAPIDTRLADTEDKLQALYETHDHFFTRNKREKQRLLQEGVDDVLESLASVDLSDAPELGGRQAYIHGKALDVFEEYNAEAEQQLARAVKLQPSDVDAWNSLGHCYWKKGDLPQAKNCFTEALAQRTNRESLRQLSMILRRMGNSPTEMSQNIDESMARAKQAVGLDLTDGASWYVLGNAYSTKFFAVSHNPEDLDKAIQAYNRAQTNGGENNPDLFMNRGNILRYLERYTEAAGDFRTAADLDPALPAEENLADIQHSVSRVADFVARKGRLKPKKLAKIVAGLPSPQADTQDSKDQSERTKATLASLEVGANAGVSVDLCRLMIASRNDNPPDCFIMADRGSHCVAMSIYHLDNTAQNKLSDRDTFTVLDPFVHEITFAGENTEEVSYRCIQVKDPRMLLVNGTPISSNCYAPPRLKLSNFDV